MKTLLAIVLTTFLGAASMPSVQAGDCGCSDGKHDKAKCEHCHGKKGKKAKNKDCKCHDKKDGEAATPPAETES